MPQATKPLPHIDRWTRPFWEACRERRLVMQKCGSTGKFWFPPGPVSPFTRTSNWDWSSLSGRGRIASYIIMHQVYFDGFADEVPYSIVQIELAEGPLMISNLVGVPLDRITVGMSVRVVFDAGPDGWTIPKFALLEAT